MARTKAVFLFIFTVATFPGLAQERDHAFEVNNRLGRGINMGNSFEAPTETAWGNPWKEEYFEIIASLGFDHVRVPIRWETIERSMDTPPYTISNTFLERIRDVVDAALKNKLHVIINMHHHDSLFEHPTDQKERFLAQWAQIADYFKDYPDSLLFEVLNEPHANLTPELWNEFFAEALEEIRENNPTRVVLLGTAEYGGLAGIPKLAVPDDEHIILTVHYYNPFNFTHQGAEWVEGSNAWLGTAWLDTEADRQSVISEFAHALDFSQTKNIPIHVGEFGATSKADMPSRERWTTFLARWFEEQGMSWAYWEFSAGFGIYNPVNEEFVAPLVDALLHYEMPEATPIFAKPVYTSDFTEGPDGWWLNQQGGAAASLTVVDGHLQIEITNGGTEAWHLQLIRENISLEKGKLYQLTFSGKANPERSVTYYAGKASDPWNAYSGYHSSNLSASDTEYSNTFLKENPSDPAARLVFDLGMAPGLVKIASVKVEELSLTDPDPEPDPDPVTSLEPETASRIHVYPNPTSDRIKIENSRGYQQARLTDIRGHCVATLRLGKESTEIDVAALPAGIYILELIGDNTLAQVRVVKF